MIGEIISIGQEIILGEIMNTNSSYLSERLLNAGVDVRFHTSVGDYPGDILNVLKIASERSDVIICTGGLGPTGDDLTREVISGFCNSPLEINEEALNNIRELFKRRNIEMSPGNEKQALFPSKAEIIKNDSGTAPGFSIKYKNSLIIALPGVPSEMKRMFEHYVYPGLKEQTKGEAIIETRILNCFGLPESALGQKILHLMNSEKEVFAGTRVRNGIISVRIYAKSRQSVNLIEETEREIRHILSDYIFSDGNDGLEHAVARELERTNSTLSTAESCTGGLIGHKLTNVSGISQYYLEGIISYSNEAKNRLLHVPEEMLKKYGAVSPEVAEKMALGVMKLSGSDCSISVTGIAGPTGGTQGKPVGLVYIGIGCDKTVKVHKFLFTGSREDIKERTANNALNLLRLELMKRKM